LTTVSHSLGTGVGDGNVCEIDGGTTTVDGI